MNFKFSRFHFRRQKMDGIIPPSWAWVEWDTNWPSAFPFPAKKKRETMKYCKKEEGYKVGKLMCDATVNWLNGKEQNLNGRYGLLIFGLAKIIIADAVYTAPFTTRDLVTRKAYAGGGRGGREGGGGG
jgi:hypothetical protein